MPHRAPTARLPAAPRPPVDRVSAVLMDAAAAPPAGLVLRLLVGERVVEVRMLLSAGDRESLAGALTAADPPGPVRRL